MMKYLKSNKIKFEGSVEWYMEGTKLDMESHKIIKRITDKSALNDRDSGQPRGFGFVEMPNKSEATKAIEALNNADYHGQYLSVKEARPKNDSQSSYGNQNRGGYSKKW